MVVLLKFHEGIEIQKNYQKAVNEFVKVVLDKYEKKIEIIILFGSVARGDAKEGADVDILVIGDVSLEELVDISLLILLEEGELILAKDIKKDRFEYLAREGYSFVRDVLRDGVVLYERMGEAFGKSRREDKVSESSF